MKKIKIDELLANEIYNNYISGISIRKLSDKYDYSFSYIQKLIKSKDYKKNINKNYPIKDGHVIVAICKKTNKKFYDYKNTSGSLTNHLKSIFNFNLPSKYKRKSVEYKTGKFWYDGYFDFQHEKVQSTKKCEYCDWTTNDINNLSGAYEKHLKSVHNISLSEYLKEFPNEKNYFKKEIYDDLVACKICGKSYKYITNTHLKKHGISQLEYKIKYENNLISPETKNKLINNYNLFLKNTPNIKVSSIEQLLIDNIPVKFTQSNRTILNGKEIDLLYNNFGFEINGCVFHTELFGKKDKNYHLNKSKDALDRNIKLYHIFEDEIHNKPDIVINKIKHILNCDNNIKRIHARKCIITENISQKEKSLFLNENHIQGNDKSKIIIGAKYNDNIVALMTFDNKRYMNKSKQNSKQTYELTRFCVKMNVISTGIASKLLKYFIKKYEPQKILSFSDRRWTPDPQNNLYTKLNFKLTKTLKPDYWYYNPKIDRVSRFHKFGFGKKNIKKRFPHIYCDDKTEWQMMQELGYDRIWDCGKFRYELNIKIK